MSAVISNMMTQIICSISSLFSLLDSVSENVWNYFHTGVKKMT